MKTKIKTLAMLEIAIVLCSMFLVATLPSIAADQTTQKVSARHMDDEYTLNIYGNANEDDTIDMRDVTYIKLIIFGTERETMLADANYDEKISMLDVVRTKLIVVGKEGKLTLIDDSGKTVTVNKPVERVVTSSRCIAEEMRAIDAADTIVGVQHSIANDPVFYPELSELPVTGTKYMGGDLNYELILSLEPDAFISSWKQGYWDVDFDEKLPGIPVIRMGAAHNFGNVHPVNFAESVRKFGYIFDKGEEADDLTRWFCHTLNDIESRTSELSEDEKPRVLLLDHFKIGGGYINHYSELRVLSLLGGGINIAAEAALPTGEIDPEWIVDQNPEIIFAVTFSEPSGYGVDDPSGLAACQEDILNRPDLPTVDAVINKQVYITGTSITRGPGYPIGGIYVAKWEQPDLFADIDHEARHQEYLDSFHEDVDLNVEDWVFAFPEPS